MNPSFFITRTDLIAPIKVAMIVIEHDHLSLLHIIFAQYDLIRIYQMELLVLTTWLHGTIQGALVRAARIGTHAPAGSRPHEMAQRLIMAQRILMRP